MKHRALHKEFYNQVLECSKFHILRDSLLWSSNYLNFLPRWLYVYYWSTIFYGVRWNGNLMGIDCSQIVSNTSAYPSCLIFIPHKKKNWLSYIWLFISESNDLIITNIFLYLEHDYFCNKKNSRAALSPCKMKNFGSVNGDYVPQSPAHK